MHWLSLSAAGCWCSYDVPLVADIHFQPTVAMMVAEAFEKIRINPGNFADGRKSFEVINYDDPAQFRAEQEQIREVSPRNSSHPADTSYPGDAVWEDAQTGPIAAEQIADRDVPSKKPQNSCCRLPY